MMQTLLVSVLVAVAALYALWYVAPVAVRQRLARWHVALGRSPRQSNCSQCGKCGAATATEADGASCPAPQVIAWPQHRQRRWRA